MKLYIMRAGGAGPYSKLKYCSVVNHSVESAMCSTCLMRYEINHGTHYVLDEISEDGTKWADFIMATGCYEDCVQRRVLDGLRSHGIRGWEAVRVEVPDYTLSGEVMSRHLKENTGRGEPLPELFVLRSLQNWGKLDLDASGLGGSEYCPECGKNISSFKKEPDRLVIDESTFDWEASDFFRFAPWGHTGLHVTRRVIEVARAERWTGVYFIPLGISNDTTTRVRSAIDPLAKDWPPRHHWN